MCSVRSFVTDDLFNFNHVNLDMLTETVSPATPLPRHYASTDAVAERPPYLSLILLHFFERAVQPPVLP